MTETAVVASVEPSQAWTTQFMTNLVATFKEEWGKEMKAHKEEVQQEMKQVTEKLEQVERDMLKKSEVQQLVKEAMAGEVGMGGGAASWIGTDAGEVLEKRQREMIIEGVEGTLSGPR